jgi:diaminopimelate epimerase
MLKFTKMHGLGNDYVYIDAIHQKVDNASLLSKKVSDRHFGIGSDGLILICKSVVADFKMQMFNADGSEAEMCGNGIRCVGKYVYDNKLTDKLSLSIETLAGIKKLKLNVKNGFVDTVRVDMGEPILDSKKIPVIKEDNSPLNLKIEDQEFLFTCVSMGNPHAVTVVSDVESFNVQKYGSKIEIEEHFPNRTNVDFIQIIDKDNILMRVWERGAGETLACGTGACASTVSCILNDSTNRKISVKLLGGKLDVEWNEDDNHIYMTGPAVTVFEGIIDEKKLTK